MLADFGLQVSSLYDYPEVPNVVEDGETFMANAEKKARETARALGVPVLADDSGLCVDALDGRPGVYSARYAGADAGDEANNRKLLQELHELHELSPSMPNCESKGDAPLRMLSAARFVCTLALYDPIKDDWVRAEGECSGFIVAQPRGENGFGYDPLFYVPSLGRTMAELNPQEKNRISHRGQALAQLAEKLRTPSQP